MDDIYLSRRRFFIQSPTALRIPQGACTEYVECLHEFGLMEPTLPPGVSLQSKPLAPNPQ